jgi:N-acetylglucosaminyl-diphospho-decaprenol L-rhamnosyltransferase
MSQPATPTEDPVAVAIAQRLSVIAINYDSAEMTGRLADAVWAGDTPPLELVVVDNASPDGSAQVLAGRDDIVLVASKENLGFGQGCMLGASRARGDLLIFLNPDIVFAPGMLRALVGGMLAVPSVAVAFPKMAGPGEPLDVQDKVDDVATMAGAVMLTSRAHLERMGGFEPRIFLYYEETDFCWRTRLAGHRVVQDWRAWAIHDHHGAGGGDRWAAEQIKNGLLVYIRLRRWPAVARFALLMVLKSLLRGLQYRDRRILDAWVVTLRRLPRLLAQRRALLRGVDPLTRAEFELLCLENDYWQRHFRRRHARERLRRLVGRGVGA